MASMRTLNLADAESVVFHGKTRKLVIQRRGGDVEVLRLPEANTVFYATMSKPTIFIRSSPSLTLEMSEGQYAALRGALLGHLLDDGTPIK